MSSYRLADRHVLHTNVLHYLCTFCPPSMILRLHTPYPKLSWSLMLEKFYDVFHNQIVGLFPIPNYRSGSACNALETLGWRDARYPWLAAPWEDSVVRTPFQSNVSLQGETGFPHKLIGSGVLNE